MLRRGWYLEFPEFGAQSMSLHRRLGYHWDMGSVFISRMALEVALGLLMSYSDAIVLTLSIVLTSQSSTGYLAVADGNEANCRTHFAAAGPPDVSHFDLNSVETLQPLVSSAGALVPLHFPVTYAHYMRRHESSGLHPYTFESGSGQHTKLRLHGPFTLISILRVCVIAMKLSRDFECELIWPLFIFTE